MSRAAAAVLVLLAAPAAAASTFRDELRRAESREASDPERAEFATRAIRAWRPDDGRLLLSHAHLRRAEALLLRREDASAEEDLTRVLENDPGNRNALLLRGRARLALGRAVAAEGDFAAYVDGASQDREGWLGLANARLPETGPGRPAEARKAAARARRLDPEDWRPDWLDGRSYMSERRYDAALEALTRAVRLAGDGSPDPYAERAEALAALGRHAEAAEDWTKALPLFERAMVEADRTRSSSKARARERDRFARAYFNRGRLREYLRETDAARSDFDEACELGHAESCAKLKSSPRPKTPARPAPSKRRRRAPSNDAGERVYGS